MPDSSVTDIGGDTSVRDMLRETARSFLGKRVKADWLTGQIDSGDPVPVRELWSAIADLGWVGATVSEQNGGAGLGLDEQLALFEEMGYGFFPGPYVSSVALAQPTLASQPEALHRLISGESIFVLAWAEPGGCEHLGDLESVECKAENRNGKWFLNGVKTDVADLNLADEVVVAAKSTEGTGFFLVDLSDNGVDTAGGESIDPGRRNGRLTLRDSTATLLISGDEASSMVPHLRRGALLAVTFEALGLAERLLEDSVEYASSREQFGKPIGAFQAVAGPLAQRYVDIALARALADWARLAVEHEDPDVDAIVSAAKAATADAAVLTGETAVQVAGGIGFTWEYHIHLYLRRSLWIERFEGGSDHHRSLVAEALLDDPAGPDLFNSIDDAEAAGFRAEVQSWIEDNLPTERRGIELVEVEREEFDRTRQDWREKLIETGHLVAHWPEEFAGRNAPPVVTAIFREEAIKAHPRVSHGDGGVDLVAPLLMHYGTEDQKQRYLGPIRDETEIWGQAFSEPDAGSDLAALKTRATRDGEDWVLNGNKIWTTYGPYATWFFVLARTNTDVKRHRGISCFIVDAESPGIEVRPIRDISDESEFAEVFFTDVRVPAENVLGDVDDGWNVAVATLAFERVIESCEDIGELSFLVDRLVDGVRSLKESGQESAESELIRNRLARIWCELQAVRLTEYSSLLALTQSEIPPPESGIIKLGWSETRQRAARLGLDLFSRPAEAGDGAENLAGFWQTAYMASRGDTIYAGTSEILRSIVAEHLLGLPRSR